MSTSPTATKAKRVYNFSPGPAVLPESVLEQAQRELMCLPGAGASILEISHRSPEFDAIITGAEENLRRLLSIPASYKVLFLQGGSRLQFSMVPMNLLRGTGQTADYLLTGSWGKKALEQARLEGETHIAWDGKATGYDRLPEPGEWKLSASPAYVHYTSNETIQGVQIRTEPEVGDAPLICDRAIFSPVRCRSIAMG